MKIKQIYEAVIAKGIEADPRGKKGIERLLREKRNDFERLDKNGQDIFDRDALFNPFSDTRIINSNDKAEIRSLIVGIDVGGEELLLVDALRAKGTPIDLVMAHHPVGKAYAQFYEVMDLQVDMFTQKGVNVSCAESLLSERRAQVERRVSAANHQREADMARWLGINLMCVHTPADNLAYRYIETLLRKEKPVRLGDIVDLLLTIPEYRQAAKDNNPPKIFIGAKNARVSNVHIEFTGGTEGPQEMYERLAAAGVDTIVAMHLSEEHFKKCKEARINAIVASHIASDALGLNCMLDYLCTKGKFNVHDFSGFRRFSHKKQK